MTAEQDDVAAMLRESARDFADREKDFSAFRGRMERSPGYDVERFGKMHALGWRAAMVREEHGGAGMGLREAAVVARELGRSLMGDLFIASSVLPVQLLQDPCALPAAGALLQAIASGTGVFALAWQERPGCLSSTVVEAATVRAGSGHALSGTKRWVAGGQAATTFLVSARVAEGIAVFAVPREAPGVIVEEAWQADGTCSPILRLDSVRLDADAMVLAGVDGAAAVTRAADVAAVAVSAELLGIAEAAFDMTIAYMKTRVQYDRAIGSFQALQHKAVDLLVQRELAAAVLAEATDAFGTGEADDAQRGSLASRCKARCSDAALRITRECIQLHGAIGYTHEYDLGLYVKRALVLAAWLGNGAQHRRRVFDAARA